MATIIKINGRQAVSEGPEITEKGELTGQI